MRRRRAFAAECTAEVQQVRRMAFFHPPEGTLWREPRRRTQRVRNEHSHFKVSHSPPLIGSPAWLCLMRFRRGAVAGGASSANRGGIGAHLTTWSNPPLPVAHSLVPFAATDW